MAAEHSTVMHAMKQAIQKRQTAVIGWVANANWASQHGACIDRSYMHAAWIIIAVHTYLPIATPLEVSESFTIFCGSCQSVM
jgi:hypothetical protein